jgi:hypothetical protein
MYPRPHYPSTPLANALRIGVLVLVLIGTMSLLVHSIVTGSGSGAVASQDIPQHVR